MRWVGRRLSRQWRRRPVCGLVRGAIYVVWSGAAIFCLCGGSGACLVLMRAQCVLMLFFNGEVVV